jgi:hypothetical protein
MFNLYSEYQYIGRSDSFSINGGSGTLYMLLYAKAVADESKKYISVRPVIACVEDVPYIGNNTSVCEIRINNTVVYSGNKSPSDKWDIDNGFLEDGYYYYKGTEVGYGEGIFKTSAAVTISCVLRLTENGEERTVEQRVYLPALTIAASIDVMDADIGSTTLIILNNRKPGYIYELYYTDANEQRRKNITYNALESTFAWTVPTTLYDWLPDDSKTTEIVVQCITYDPSAVYLNSFYTKITVRARERDCLPDLSYEASIDEKTAALTNSPWRIIEGVSQLTLELQYNAKHGASIEKVSVEAGRTYDGSGGRVVIQNIKTKDVSISVTDSRGFTKRIALPLTSVPYIKPTLVPVIERTSPTSDSINLSFSGNAYIGTFDQEETVVNTVTASALSRPAGSKEWTNEIPLLDLMFDESGFYHGYAADYPVSGYDYDKVYEFKIVVEDLVGSVEKTFVLKKGLPIFDWDDNDIRFRVPVSSPGSPLYVKSELAYGDWSGDSADDVLYTDLSLSELYEAYLEERYVILWFYVPTSAGRSGTCLVQVSITDFAMAGENAYFSGHGIASGSGDYDGLYNVVVKANGRGQEENAFDVTINKA